jgi:hypothetical protein
MVTLDQPGEWALAIVPVLGALIIIKGTGLGMIADTVVAVCAVVALLSFAHVINVTAMLGLA